MSSSAFSVRAFFVVLLLIAPVAVGAVPVVAQDPGDQARSVSFIAPAVGERADGSLVGVGMEVQVTIRSGSGGVFLDTRPLTQLDMQGSARLAATMAASVAGSDFQEHDFLVKVRTPTTAVGGPSAGGAMAAAFMALLLDVPVRGDVMMTGMINPDGSIGPVGGILQKAEAAHRDGARLFLIPEGQGVVRHFNEEGHVDVAEHAQREWGLTVREVSDLHEAFRFITDHALERPEVPETTRSPVFDEVMGDAARGQLVEADERHDRVRGELDGSGLSPGDREALGDVLDRARDRLDRAHGALEAGAPYTASSRAFQASVEISRVELWILVSENEAARALGDELERVSRGVNLAVDNASRAPLDDLATLEVVGAAQVRAAEADRLVDRSRDSLDRGDLQGALESLAFARERVRSVAWWLSMADAISGNVELMPLEADPRDLAGEYRQVAREARTYAEVLGAQMPGGEAHGLIDLAGSKLTDSQLAQDAGLHAGSLYLAVESQVAAHAALSLMGSQALIGDRLDRQRAAALFAVEDARRLGLEPFLAASFREFAQALEQEDEVSALLFYANAAMVATISAALGGGERQVFGIGSPSGEPPLVSRVGFAPDPWTAYFALATIVFGFMAGILVTLIVVQAREPGPGRKGATSGALATGRSVSRRGVAAPEVLLRQVPPRHGNGHVRVASRRGVSDPVLVVAARRRGTSDPARSLPRSGLK